MKKKLTTTEIHIIGKILSDRKKSIEESQFNENIDYIVTDEKKIKLI